MIGKRHAFLGDYKIAATPEGKIIDLQLDFYSDAGKAQLKKSYLTF